MSDLSKLLDQRFASFEEKIGAIVSKEVRRSVEGMRGKFDRMAVDVRQVKNSLSSKDAVRNVGSGELMSDEGLIERLYDIEAVKFGDFTLKSGIQSPIYIDLRVIISYTDVMKAVSEKIWKVCQQNNIKFDQVCGVPYTALPIATFISTEHDVPMVIKRKEAKSYGTKKMIEGIYKQGDECLIIEDVVSTGSSVMETAQCLMNHGMKVNHAIVMLDRAHGGKDKLKKEGINLTNVFSLPQVLDVLLKINKITSSQHKSVNEFIKANQIANDDFKIFSKPSSGAGDASYGGKVRDLSFESRAQTCTNPIGAKLMRIIAQKKTNLCLSADVTSPTELLELADSLGPYICCMKTHVDTLDRFDMSLMVRLQQLATKHDFVVFEDRKFADIGNTVKSQLSGGIYKIAEWADLVNCHSLPGPQIVTGLQQAAKSSNSQMGLLLIGQMSSQGNLLDVKYTQQTVDMANLPENKDFVVGFISQGKISQNPAHIHFTPGVKLAPGSDSLGQRYTTPYDVIVDKQSDVIIVGRGILEAGNRVEACVRFRDAAWHAYLQKIRK